MSAKKEYTAPELEVIRFDGRDIITDSSEDLTQIASDDTRLPRM